ncbi:MAG: PadR family transcriptional regulator [Kineosporiaceae bacterium]|nr:PadR family transcriptional regulator [Kineosporiaceae bacterium]MBK7624553.1 PadR family transcriptional regulator [Kineosporiaceae bacterium]MBK8077076.1 PadR family transcriptional regulator [Kineosporiaceae bacterium]
MAALATTISVLGAVALFEPVNGYQVRRELLSWQLDQWAQIKPGSIYSMLATLTRQGYLERHDISDDGRAVAVHTTTVAGRHRLAQLLDRALTEADPLSPLPFHVALMMAGLLPREQVAACLTRRLDNLAALDRDLATKLDLMTSGERTPPDVIDVVRLSQDLTRTEIAWVQRRLADLEAGRFSFAGEPMTWTPAADDPGHQMTAERARYRRLLALPDPDG